MTAAAKALLPRADIPTAQTWNKESVFATVEAWQAEYNDLKIVLEDIKPFIGTLSQSPARLADWMDVATNIRRRVAKLVFYPNMATQVDTGDMAAKELLGQAQGILAEAEKWMAFQRPELLAIGEATLQQWMKDEPRLAIYRHYIANLFRQQAHVRSGEVEEILGMANDPFRMAARAHSELTNTDLTFKPAIDKNGEPFDVSQGSLGRALQTNDATLRRTAWQHYMDGHLQFKNTLASIYIASVKQNVFDMRARHYTSTLEAQLFPFNLPVDVFHNLIHTYKANLPTWHRYWEVKRKALKQDTIHPWDIWAPLVDNDPDVPYEQSVEWISKGMLPLGADYVEVMKRGCLEQRWVDYAPNIGKRQGAFSAGTYDTYPFIMMTYNEGLRSLSTLAHELGHSMHSYYSRKMQPEIYARYSMFVAEVASNFNQALTRACLFEEKKDDKEFQIALIEEAMGNFHRYFFIMPTLAAFEYEVHSRAEAGKPLTADILNGIMRDLFAAGYGDTLTNDAERTGITWATFGHLYVPFYTFQYATGISAAHALADDVLSGKPGAAENYRQFLSLGGSVYPLDALKIAGVDMSTPAAVEKTYAILGAMVDKLAALTA